MAMFDLGAIEASLWESIGDSNDHKALEQKVEEAEKLNAPELQTAVSVARSVLAEKHPVDDAPTSSVGDDGAKPPLRRQPSWEATLQAHEQQEAEEREERGTREAKEREMREARRRQERRSNAAKDAREAKETRKAREASNERKIKAELLELLKVARRGDDIPHKFGSSTENFQDGSLAVVVQNCLLNEASEHAKRSGGGADYYMERFIFAHELIGKDHVVEVYCWGVGYYNGGAGAGKARLLKKSELRKLKPVSSLIQRFDDVYNKPW